MLKWQLMHQKILRPKFLAYCGLADINQRLFTCYNNNALAELNDCIGGLLHFGPNVITFRILLHLGPNLITFRTLLHLGPNLITFRTLLQLRQFLYLGLQHTYAVCISSNPPHIYLLPKPVLAPSWICPSDHHFKLFRLKLRHILLLILSFLILLSLPLSLSSLVYYFHFH